MAYGSIPKGGRARVTINIAQLRQQVPGNIQRLVQKVVQDAQIQLLRDIYKEVVETTPVLTGQARNNWDIGLGDKPFAVVYGATDVEETGVTITPAEREKVRQAVTEIRGQGIGVFQKVWITNLIHYISSLDVGDSTKAPNGIRAIAVQKALSKKLKLKGVTSSQDVDEL